MSIFKLTLIEGLTQHNFPILVRYLDRRVKSRNNFYVFAKCLYYYFFISRSAQMLFFYIYIQMMFYCLTMNIISVKKKKTLHSLLAKSKFLVTAPIQSTYKYILEKGYIRCMENIIYRKETNFFLLILPAQQFFGSVFNKTA